MKDLLGLWLISLVINVLTNVMHGGNVKSIILIQSLLTLLFISSYLLAG